MITTRLALLLAAALLAWQPVTSAQEGPRKEGSETVARPRKKAAEAAAEPAKIPSKLSKKERPALPDGVPTFRSDVNAVSVEVAVLDNKGRFIPGIPRGNFRVIEDGVPQQISNFGLGQAPMTICLVIEFSNLFQKYWSESWYQTLTAAYGFLESLKPEDYVAVVAYDLRSEILSDF